MPIEGVVYCDPERAAEYLRARAWIDNTIGEALHATAQRYPTRDAYISDERNVTFEELDQLTDRLGAALLNIGLVTGDRAIFQMGTTIETAIALLACYKIGVVPVCAVPQYREVEIGQLTEQSAAKGYFVQGDIGSFDLIGFAKQMMARYPSLKH